ncbi:hypothetical protein L218DRAFT_998031 [Marasmius fiardii PR-910]|nr:hypothetical protein L218DRAFT_998031 [Marasmius fiardii PR-910]
MAPNQSPSDLFQGFANVGSSTSTVSEDCVIVLIILQIIWLMLELPMRKCSIKQYCYQMLPVFTLILTAQSYVAITTQWHLYGSLVSAAVTHKLPSLASSATALYKWSKIPRTH